MIDTYQPVRRQEKLSIQVAEQITELIVDGKLQEGDRLPPEREFCEMFNVSRTVIREAVSILEAKGLVASMTGSGTYVRSLQREDVVNSLGLFISTNSKTVSMMHLIEVREVIEMQVARLAAKHATEEDITALESVLKAMCQRVDNPEAFAEKDLEFHMLMARATGNPLFEIMLQPLTDFMLQLIFVGSNLPGTAEEACGHHQRVLEAIKLRDPDRAEEAIGAHLEQSERVSIKGLREKDKLI